MALIRHLPRESALVQSTVGEPAQWGTTDYLLASVVDGLNELIYVTISANSKSRPQRPEPVRRPRLDAADDESPRMARPSEIAAFFGAGDGTAIGGR